MVEADAWFDRARVSKRRIDRQLPRHTVQVRQQHSRFALLGAVDHDSVAARVDGNPVRVKRGVHWKRRDLCRMRRIGHIEADYLVRCSRGNNQIVSDDRGDGTPFTVQRTRGVNGLDARVPGVEVEQPIELTE